MKLKATKALGIVRKAVLLLLLKILFYCFFDQASADRLLSIQGEDRKKSYLVPFVCHTADKFAGLISLHAISYY